MRVISHSEASSALACPAKHAFAYTGRLTGGTALSSKVKALRLRAGSAWGAAVAAWHEFGDRQAYAALYESLDSDAKEMQEFGGYDSREHLELAEHLGFVLAHYIDTAPRFNHFHSPERELRIDIPGMPGFGFLGYIDGIEADEDARNWIVEFKLRDKAGNFTAPDVLPLLRQPRWYALAAEKSLGFPIAGVILDERESGFPGPVKLNKADKEGRQAPRKGQAGCSVDDYLAAAEAAGMAPDEETVEKLRRRVWHKRQEVIFLPGELEEAELELRSLAQTIRDLDSGERYPVRAAGPLCRSCDFREICPEPGAEEIVSMLFKRVPPKRERVNDKPEGR
jgi:hypothetical protein